MKYFSFYKILHCSTFKSFKGEIFFINTKEDLIDFTSGMRVDSNITYIKVYDLRFPDNFYLLKDVTPNLHKLLRGDL